MARNQILTVALYGAPGSKPPRSSQMQDALSGKIGKAHASGMGWEYLLAHGPVGGSHYLISELKSDGSAGKSGAKIVSLQRLEPYDFYESFEVALGKQAPARGAR